jgi:2-polyprenyl-6-methoxyphenol hydroxylase-like FAD-dependent oxidoreductase
MVLSSYRGSTSHLNCAHNGEGLSIAAPSSGNRVLHAGEYGDCETMDRLDTSVLIVGAGPAGLASAIELGGRGIACLVVEKNERVGFAPRAKTTHTRTREHLRRWGIAQKLADASPFGIDYPSNVIFVTRLAGHQLAKFENAFHCSPKRNHLYSEHAQWIPQYKLEDVLQEHAQSLSSVTLKFNTEFLTCSQNDEEVQSRVRNVETGEEYEVHSEYLIGADGARSVVRDVIGAKLEGVYGLSRNYNIVFRAPELAQAHSHGQAIMYWQVNPDAPSLIGPMDSGDRWFFMPTGVPKDFTLSKSEAVDFIKKSTGIDTPIEILSSDEWVASRFIADKYREARVFLAGDACHLHPPFGGYGMNMGIADSVDIGWKLAAVIKGWGGASLLDTYTEERRAVHQFVIDEAVANHALLGNQLWQEGLEDPGQAGDALRAVVREKIVSAKTREFHSLGVVLGYRYKSDTIIEGAGTDNETQQSLEYRPSATPGSLAPHMWLPDGSSLYDHFGDNFTLIALGSDQADLQILTDLADKSGVPTKILTLGHPKLLQLYETRYVLIRPDQHVAWRGDSLPDPSVFEIISGNLSRQSSYQKCEDPAV